MQRSLNTTQVQTPVTEDDLRDPISAHFFNNFFTNQKPFGKLSLLNHTWTKQIDTIPLDYKALLSFWLYNTTLKRNILFKNKHFQAAMKHFEENQKDKLTPWERLCLSRYFHDLSMQYISCEDAVKAIILLEPIYAREFVSLIRAYPDSLQAVLRHEKSDWATLLNVLVYKELTELNVAEIETALKNVLVESSLFNTMEDQLFVRRLSDSISSTIYAINKDDASFRCCHSDVFKNLTKIDLSGSLVNLSGMELSYNNCVSAVFDEATLSKINLTGADLFRASLRKANLRQARLVNAQLPLANLTEAILDEADLSHALLHNAALRNSKLVGAKLTNAIIFEADLQNADLSRSMLQGAHISSSNLNGATLTAADLSESDLCGNDIRNANLVSANLFLAQLTKNDFGDTNFENANLSRSNLAESKLIRPNLRNTDLSFANLANTTWSRPLLENTNVKFAILIGANIFESDTRTYLKSHGAIMNMADLATAYESGQISVSLRFIQELCVCVTGEEINEIRMTNSFDSLSSLIKRLEDCRAALRSNHSDITVSGTWKPRGIVIDSIDKLLPGLRQLDIVMHVKPIEHTAPTMRWS